MDDSSGADRAAPADLRVHARSLALLYGVGATFVLVTTLLYRPGHQNQSLLLAIAGIAYFTALALRSWSQLAPAWGYPLLVVLGTLLITVGIDATGEGASPYAAFYVWVAVYSYYFFPRWQANVEVALVGLAYALVLALGPDSSGPAARWAITVGTILVTGRLVASLVDQVRARATEAAARAERLRQVERRTRAIIDTASDGFVAMDANGDVTAFSPRAEEISGLRRDEVLGRPLAASLVPYRFREAFQLELAQFLETGSSPLVNQPIEFTGARKADREFPGEVTISPLRDGDTWTFNAFFRDISARKRSEREIREH